MEGGVLTKPISLVGVTCNESPPGFAGVFPPKTADGVSTARILQNFLIQTGRGLPHRTDSPEFSHSNRPMGSPPHGFSRIFSFKPAGGFPTERIRRNFLIQTGRWGFHRTDSTGFFHPNRPMGIPPHGFDRVFSSKPADGVSTERIPQSFLIQTGRGLLHRPDSPEFSHSNRLMGIPPPGFAGIFSFKPVDGDCTARIRQVFLIQTGRWGLHRTDSTDFSLQKQTIDSPSNGFNFILSY